MEWPELSVCELAQICEACCRCVREQGKDLAQTVLQWGHQFLWFWRWKAKIWSKYK